MSKITGKSNNAKESMIFTSPGHTTPLFSFAMLFEDPKKCRGIS
jgi:hypothetical protein